MSVSLIRFRAYSEAAMLIPGSTELVRIQRTRNAAPGRPYWLPDVPKHGYFEHYDGVLVALYRVPSDPDTLWFQLGARRVRLFGGITTRFSPPLDENLPVPENSSVPRHFALEENGMVVLEHAYVLDDLEKRVAHGRNPFPAWPDYESDYDLCFLVHCFMTAGTWPQVLPTPGPR